MTSIQSDLRALLDSRGEAIGKKNIDRLMSLYFPDIVYFDLVPPLTGHMELSRSGGKSDTGYA